MSYIIKQIKKIDNNYADADEKFLLNEQAHSEIISELSSVEDYVSEKFYERFQNVREGEIAISINGNAETTQLIKKCNVSTDASTLNNLMQNPVGMNTIFNQWYRFSHFTDGQNLNTTPHVNGRNKWSYNSSTNAIYTNLNSEVYMGFVSPKRYKTYYLKVRLDGDDDDNDMIGIVLAFITDNQGIEHTLSLVRCKMIESHTHYRYALVYDYLLTTEFKLMDKEDYIQDVSGGWKNTFVIIEAKRSNSTIEMCTSQIGNSNLDPLSKMTYTLPETQPSNYSLEMYQNLKKMLLEQAQIGFSAYSETGHFTVQEQKYVFDDNKIYDFTSGNVYEYKSNKWNVVSKIDTALKPCLLYSEYNHSLYSYTDNTIKKLM